MFKEIFSEWWKSLKSFSTTGWKAIRKLFSSSFHLIKEPILIFLKALWEWIKVIIVGMFEILKSFLKDFVKSTAVMLWKLLVLFYQWVKEKIKKK